MRVEIDLEEEDVELSETASAAPAVSPVDSVPGTPPEVTVTADGDEDHFTAPPGLVDLRDSFNAQQQEAEAAARWSQAASAYAGRL